MTPETKKTLEDAGWIPAPSFRIDHPTTSMYIRSQELIEKDPIDWALKQPEAREELVELVQRVKDRAIEQRLLE